MRWILIDLALALFAIALLGVLLLRLWRKVKALSTTVARASDTLGQATDALAVAQGPLGQDPPPRGPSPRDASTRDVAGRSPAVASRSSAGPVRGA